MRSPLGGLHQIVLMSKWIKSLKLNAMVSAIATCALGIALLVWPGNALALLCRVIAIGLIILGLGNMFSYVGNRSAAGTYNGISGVIGLLIGIWLFTNPGSVVSIIPIVIGVIVLFHGVRDLRYAAEIRQHNGGALSSFVAGVISCILGLVCIFFAFNVVSFAMQIIGIILLYDGISDLLVIYRAGKAVRDHRSREGAIDGDFREL